MSLFADSRAHLVQQSRDAVAVLLNNGNGSSGAVRRYTVDNSGPGAITAADFDGDGKTDIAATTSYNTDERSSGAVSLLYNRGCSNR